MSFIKKCLKSDRGDSEIISLIFVLPLLLAVFVSIIDGGLYINNRSIMQSTARDSARTVATMGGNGNSTAGTPIEVKYGLNKGSACTNDMASNSRTSKAFNSGLTPIECNLLKSIKNNTSFTNVIVNSVKCGPERTNGTTITVNGKDVTETPASGDGGGLGSSVYCTVNWTYNSVPGSPMSIFKGMKDNNTTGYAESDVDMTNIDLVARTGR